MKLIISCNTASLLEAEGFRSYGLRCTTWNDENPCILAITRCDPTGYGRAVLEVPRDEALVIAVKYKCVVVSDAQYNNDHECITLQMNLYALMDSL